MYHSVFIVDKLTEEVLSKVLIPAMYAAQVKALMGWTSDEDAVYDYALLPSQLQAIEQLLERTLETPNCIYYLSGSEIRDEGNEIFLLRSSIKRLNYWFLNLLSLRYMTNR